MAPPVQVPVTPGNAKDLHTMSRRFMVVNHTISFEDARTIIGALYESGAITYAVVAQEMGELGNTPHVHMYIIMKGRIRGVTCRGILERGVSATSVAPAVPGFGKGKVGHIEACWADDAANIKYAQKENNFIVFGEDPVEAIKTARAEREADKHDVYEEAMELAKNKQIHKIKGALQIRHWKALHDIANYVERPTENLDYQPGVWIWGPVRTAKTTTAQRAFPGYYFKQQNKWWDLYQGEAVVIIDELDPEHAKTLKGALKVWADPSVFSIETKGGSMSIRPEFIIVTCNMSIDEIYRNGTKAGEIDAAAMHKRFREIHFDTYRKYGAGQLRRMIENVPRFTLDETDDDESPPSDPDGAATATGMNLHQESRFEMMARRAEEAREALKATRPGSELPEPPHKRHSALSSRGPSFRPDPLPKLFTKEGLPHITTEYGHDQRSPPESVVMGGSESESEVREPSQDTRKQEEEYDAQGREESDARADAYFESEYGEPDTPEGVNTQPMPQRASESPRPRPSFEGDESGDEETEASPYTAHVESEATESARGESKRSRTSFQEQQSQKKKEHQAKVRAARASLKEQNRFGTTVSEDPIPEPQAGKVPKHKVKQHTSETRASMSQARAHLADMEQRREAAEQMRAAAEEAEAQAQAAKRAEDAQKAEDAKKAAAAAEAEAKAQEAREAEAKRPAAPGVPEAASAGDDVPLDNDSSEDERDRAHAAKPGVNRKKFYSRSRAKTENPNETDEVPVHVHRATSWAPATDGMPDRERSAPPAPAIEP